MSMLSGCRAVTVFVESVSEPDEHSEPSTPLSVPSSRAAELRSRLDETLRGLEHRLSAARALAQRVEGMLDSDEQFVRAWQQTAKAARERLAAIGGL